MKKERCQNCGKILKKGASFCTECGAPIENEEQVVTGKEYKVTQNDQSENGQPKNDQPEKGQPEKGQPKNDQLKNDQPKNVQPKGKTRRIFYLIIIAVFLCAVGLGIYGGIKYQEKRKQQRIETILSSLEEEYPTLNFPVLFQYYDELDELGYDTSEMREIAWYDQENYTAAIAVYNNIQSVNEKLHSSDYHGLSALMGAFDDTLDAAEQIEINEQSKIGEYIKDLTTDLWYTGYKGAYYHTSIDLDYGLTSSGHAFVITVYTEPLAEIEFPYDEAEVDFHKYEGDKGNAKTESTGSDDTSAETDLTKNDAAQDSKTEDAETDSNEESATAESVNTKEKDEDEKNADEQSSDAFYPVTEYNKQPDYSQIYGGNLQVDYSNLPDNLDIHLFPTEHGEICGFITNTSDEVVDNVTIQLNYKDANGQTIKTDSDGHDTLLPGYTVVSRFDCPKEFTSISFEFKFRTSGYQNHSPYVNINSNLGENSIILEITNNWDKKISKIEYEVVLYKKNRIVEIKYSDGVYDAEAGSTVTKEVNTWGQDFDRYEIYLNNARTF